MTTIADIVSCLKQKSYVDFNEFITNLFLKNDPIVEEIINNSYLSKIIDFNLILSFCFRDKKCTSKFIEKYIPVDLRFLFSFHSNFKEEWEKIITSDEQTLSEQFLLDIFNLNNPNINFVNVLSKTKYFTKNIRNYFTECINSPYLLKLYSSIFIVFPEDELFIFLFKLIDLDEKNILLNILNQLPNINLEKDVDGKIVLFMLENSIMPTNYTHHCDLDVEFAKRVIMTTDLDIRNFIFDHIELNNNIFKIIMESNNLPCIFRISNHLHFENKIVVSFLEKNPYYKHIFKQNYPILDNINNLNFVKNWIKMIYATFTNPRKILIETFKNNPNLQENKEITLLFFEYIS